MNEQEFLHKKVQFYTKQSKEWLIKRLLDTDGLVLQLASKVVEGAK